MSLGRNNLSCTFTRVLARACSSTRNAVCVGFGITSSYAQGLLLTQHAEIIPDARDQTWLAEGKAVPYSLNYLSNL